MKRMKCKHLTNFLQNDLLELFTETFQNYDHLVSERSCVQLGIDILRTNRVEPNFREIEIAPFGEEQKD